MSTTQDKAAKPTGSPRFLPIAVAMAAVLILTAGGILAYALHESPSGLSGGLLAGTVGGPFRLIDQNGQPFTDADLKGKWHLVFFGYTHCPDVCPTTLNDLSLAFDKLDAPQQKAVSVVFISVDPERDTPAVMKAYVANFDAPIVGLTGSAAAVRQAARDYHVYYAKHDEADGSYEMDHSAVIYVMNPQGRFVSTITPDEAVGDIAAKLGKLVS
jgi:protein SCO1/2